MYEGSGERRESSVSKNLGNSFSSIGFTLHLKNYLCLSPLKTRKIITNSGIFPSINDQTERDWGGRVDGQRCGI